jgi:hypothetical protein
VKPTAAPSDPPAAGRALWIALLILAAAALLIPGVDAWRRGGRAVPREAILLARCLGAGFPALLPAGHPAGRSHGSRVAVDGRFAPGVPAAPDGAALLGLRPAAVQR